MHDKFWMGTEADYLDAQAKLTKYEDYIQANVKAMDDDEEKDSDDDILLSVQDGVGIIDISGPLYNGTLGVVGKWFGVVGYGDIQNALLAAMKNYDVRSIMLQINSPGGSVAGVQETAELIRSIDAHKPVTAYTSSTMASAALWLGVSARSIATGPVGMVGSIGTLIVMMSRYEQLKKEGIEAVVVRSGKYKALGHPAEPMSEAAIDDAQAKADYLADMFLSYVADRRGTTKVAADTKFGQGRVFIGQQALDVGLVDSVLSYSDAFVKTKALAPISDNKMKVFGASVEGAFQAGDNPANRKDNQMPNPHIPTPEELAAMAAGVELSAAEDTQAADAPAAPEGTTAQEQIEALNAQLATAAAEAATHKAEAESNLAIAGSLAEIVRASIKTMSVALGVANAHEATEPGKLAEAHKEVSAQFKAKFKAGGVAATKPEAQDQKPAPAALVNPLFAAAAQLKK